METLGFASQPRDWFAFIGDLTYVSGTIGKYLRPKTHIRKEG